jgi:hypothetical protein
VQNKVCGSGECESKFGNVFRNTLEFNGSLFAQTLSEEIEIVEFMQFPRERQRMKSSTYMV